MKIFIRHRLETFSALGVIVWGLFLLNPFVDSFVRFANYGELAKHATENEWGAIAVLIGVISLIGIYSGQRDMRRVGMIGACTFRLFLAILIGLQTHFTSAGVGDFTLWALMAAAAYYRIDYEF